MPHLMERSFFAHAVPRPTRENFKGGSVRHGSVRGYRFQRPPAERSEAPAGAKRRGRSAPRAAKRGRPAERSEAPPSEARLHRGSAERSEVAQRSPGGRHYKTKTQKGSTPESPLRGGLTTHIWFFFKKPGYRKTGKLIFYRPRMKRINS